MEFHYTEESTKMWKAVSQGSVLFHSSGNTVLIRFTTMHLFKKIQKHIVEPRDVAQD